LKVTLLMMDGMDVSKERLVRWETIITAYWLKEQARKAEE